MPLLTGACVAYLRASERPYSRLNLAKQRASLRQSMRGDKTWILREFVEIEPLTRGDRPEFRKAIELCQERGATLLIGKLDRMRSAVRWLRCARENGVKFRGADVPHVNQLTMHYLEICEQEERSALGDAVAKGLARSSPKGGRTGDGHNTMGLKLGPSFSAKARQAAAYHRDEKIWAIIQEIRYRGVTTLHGLAVRLNQEGICTPRGGAWSAAQVRRVVKKFESAES